MSLWTPNSLVEALERLPASKHPLMDKEDTIAYLHHIREKIWEAIIREDNLSLSDRTWELSREEYMAMIETSFYPNTDLQIESGYIYPKSFSLV